MTPRKLTAQGRFAEAERSYLIALEEARTFGAEGSAVAQHPE